MNLGIDIDGTLTAHVEFFTTLGKLWRAGGGKVYLITGLGPDGVEHRREKWPVLNDTSFYDEIITTGKYNDAEKSLIGKEADNERIVGRFKQRMCKELGVSIMFDDQALKHREFGDVPIFQVPASATSNPGRESVDAVERKLHAFIASLTDEERAVLQGSKVKATVGGVEVKVKVA